MAVMFFWGEYTPHMTLTLDPQLEQQIQREIAAGNYQEPKEVIAHALSLLDAERKLIEEDRDAIDAHLERSMAQIERREGISGDRARLILAERRGVLNSRPNRQIEPKSLTSTV